MGGARGRASACRCSTSWSPPSMVGAAIGLLALIGPREPLRSRWVLVGGRRWPRSARCPTWPGNSPTVCPSSTWSGPRPTRAPRVDARGSSPSSSCSKRPVARAGVALRAWSVWCASPNGAATAASAGPTCAARGRPAGHERQGVLHRRLLSAAARFRGLTGGRLAGPRRDGAARRSLAVALLITAADQRHHRAPAPPRPAISPAAPSIGAQPRRWARWSAGRPSPAPWRACTTACRGPCGPTRRSSPPTTVRRARSTCSAAADGLPASLQRPQRLHPVGPAARPRHLGDRRR